MEEKGRPKKESRHSSLRKKWFFYILPLFFLVFIVFAGISYYCIFSTIRGIQETKVRKTLSEMVSDLSNQEDPFTKQSIEEYIRKKSNSTENLSLKNSDIILQSVGIEEGDLAFYDASGLVLFETGNFPFSRLAKPKTTLSFQRVRKENGIFAIEEIYSKDKQLLGYVQLFDVIPFYDEKLNQTWQNIIQVQFFLLLILAIISWIMMSIVLRPLNQMIDIVGVLENDPQTPIRMPLRKSQDEFYELTRIFNDMVDRMQLYIEQQQQFVEDVSHELRTPVAIIEGHLTLLNRWGKDDPEVLEESLAASLQEILRMKTLVQEMLDLSRAEQVDVYYRNETTMAKEVIAQTVNNFRLIYQDFIFTLDEDVKENVEVYISRHHLEQVLIIVLDNAVKYSSKRLEVHISASQAGKELEVAIQDFGEGISQQDLTKIFNRFYRVDKARSRNRGGNGLGLSIARQLIEGYQGRISAESAEGSGTVFRIVLKVK